MAGGDRTSYRSYASWGAMWRLQSGAAVRRSTPGWTQLSATFFPYGGPLINARLVKAAAPRLSHLRLRELHKELQAKAIEEAEAA